MIEYEFDEKKRDISISELQESIANTDSKFNQVQLTLMNFLH